MQRLKKILSYTYEYAHLFICALGVCSIIFQSQILSIFPYVFGGVMILIGITGIVLGLLRLLVNEKKSQVFSYSFMLLVLGIIFIIKHADEESIGYIGIAWGMIGLFRSASNFVLGITEFKTNKLVSVVTILEALFTFVVSILLLIEPIESISHHIVLFGVEMIAVSICMLFGIHGGMSVWKVLQIKEENKENINSKNN